MGGDRTNVSCYGRAWVRNSPSLSVKSDLLSQLPLSVSLSFSQFRPPLSVCPSLSSQSIIKAHFLLLVREGEGDGDFLVALVTTGVCLKLRCDVKDSF
jgi:hypothetical protein